MRRLLAIIVPMVVALGLAGTHGSRADGHISLSHPLGPASRVLPTVEPAQAAARRRPPLRFTLVDAAGAVVHRHPNGPVIGMIAGTTPLGTHSWAWALRVGPNHDWAQVVLPWRPNGRSGWIQLDGRLRIHTAYWVRADLSSRTVTLMKGRHPRIVFRAAVGAAGTPTPTGKFFVTDRVATGDPYGPFGWFAFGLSGHQPNLPAGWSGGDQLAIHGTNAPSSIGTAASAGCLRVSATALSTLRRYLRLGTPVVIRH